MSARRGGARQWHLAVDPDVTDVTIPHMESGHGVEIGHGPQPGSGVEMNRVSLVDPLDLVEIDDDFDGFEMVVEETDPARSDRRVFVPTINGSDLRELLRPIELQQGAGKLAAAYGGLNRSVHWPLKKHFLGKGDAEAGRTVVLGCSCGISDCWPFYVQITVGIEDVRWESFRLPFREWSYEALEGFRFERWRYEAELDRVEELLGRDTGSRRR